LIVSKLFLWRFSTAVYEDHRIDPNDDRAIREYALKIFVVFFCVNFLLFFFTLKKGPNSRTY